MRLVLDKSDDSSGWEVEYNYDEEELIEDEQRDRIQVVILISRVY